MTFERTEDWAEVKRIITHPKIYKWVSDDYSPAPENYEPSADNIHILVKDGAQTLGMWVFSGENGVCWKIHTCLLPEAWGEKAKRAAAELGPWLWATYPRCYKVITDVPSYNRLALQFAKLVGMKEFGVNFRSYMKNGKLHDQIMLGISRPGVI